MDPNETLKRMRTLASEVLELADGGAYEEDDKVTELAEAVEALDSWLSLGGFKPKAWK